jgi:transcriptional regulator with XRE-family HTH domain
MCGARDEVDMQAGSQGAARRSTSELIEVTEADMSVDHAAAAGYVAHMTKPNPRPITANMVVAMNLARARKMRGMTQEHAADYASVLTGTAWSKATWSAAERSASGERVKHFNAHEIACFARMFDLPIAWFFVPPTRSPDPDRKWAVDPEHLLELIFSDQALTALADRLEEVTAADFFGLAELTDDPDKFERLKTLSTSVEVRRRLGLDLASKARELRAMAEELDGWSEAAEWQVGDWEPDEQEAGDDDG